LEGIWHTYIITAFSGEIKVQIGYNDFFTFSDQNIHDMLDRGRKM